MDNPADDIRRLAAFQSEARWPANELFTQDLVALKFAERHGAKLRYDHHQGVWFLWAGTH